MAEQQRSRWQRLRAWLAAQRSSDIITAQVGQGAQNVIIGKNIVKIGTFVVPTLPVILTLVGLLVGGAGGLWMYRVPATMPAGSFNVAVADFAPTDGANRRDAELLSRQLFLSVQQRLSRVADTTDVRVWHDSMSGLEKRGTIGIIAGANAEQRRAAACARAEDLNAAVLIYGTLDSTTTPATLRLEFCVRRLPQDTRSIGVLAETEQVDPIGGPLLVDLPVGDASTSSVARSTHGILITYLVIGLRYELSTGNAQDQLELALRTFEEGKRQMLAQSSRPQGIELLDYFIGRVQFQLGQSAPTGSAAWQTHLDAAEAAFGAARTGATPLPRATVGLAAVMYRRALALSDDEQATGGVLDQAAALAAQGRDEAHQQQLGAVEAEALLVLASVQRQQSQALVRSSQPDRARAWALLDDVDATTAALLATLDPAFVRLHTATVMLQGVTAQQRAGMAAQEGDQPRERAALMLAQERYRTCIAVAETDRGDMLLQQDFVERLCRPQLASVQQRLATIP